MKQTTSVCWWLQWLLPWSLPEAKKIQPFSQSSQKWVVATCYLPETCLVLCCCWLVLVIGYCQHSKSGHPTVWSRVHSSQRETSLSFFEILLSSVTLSQNCWKNVGHLPLFFTVPDFHSFCHLLFFYLLLFGDFQRLSSMLMFCCHYIFNSQNLAVKVPLKVNLEPRLASVGAFISGWHILHSSITSSSINHILWFKKRHPLVYELS